MAADDTYSGTESTGNWRCLHLTHQQGWARSIRSAGRQGRKARVSCAQEPGKVCPDVYYFYLQNLYYPGMIDEANTAAVIQPSTICPKM